MSTDDFAGTGLLIPVRAGTVADFQSQSRTESAEVTEPAEPGRDVSLGMPHKRNPVLATLISAAATQVPALAPVLAQYWLAVDLRSAGVRHAEWELLRECLRLTGCAAGAAAELTG